MSDNNLNKPQKFKYSILTIVLLICIIELSVSAIQNISKDITFSAKIKGLEEKRNEELDKNKQLKSEIENYNSDKTLESIARNNLKMAGKDEILIILNNPDEKTSKEETSNEKNKNKNRKTAS